MPPRVTLADRIDAWKTDTERETPLSALKVVHVVDRTPGREVDGLVVPINKPWAARDVAARFRGKCEMFCQDLPGVQTFQVQAFFGQPEIGEVFHLVVNGALEFEGGVTEDATPKGAMQQGMRLGEAIVQRTFGMQSELIRWNDQLMGRLMQANDRLQAECDDSRKIIYDMVEKRIEGERAKRMEELEFERSTKEREALMTALPAILRGVFGGKVIPAETADSAMMRLMAIKLRGATPAERADFIGRIPPLFQAPFMARMKELDATLAQEEEGTKLLQEANESDATDGLDMRSPLDSPADGKGIPSPATANGTGGLQ